MKESLKLLRKLGVAHLVKYIKVRKIKILNQYFDIGINIKTGEEVAIKLVSDLSQIENDMSDIVKLLHSQQFLLTIYNSHLTHYAMYI